MGYNDRGQRSEDAMPMPILGPSLTVVTGSMFSGKSEELIRRLLVLQYSGIRALVVKPGTDSRTDAEIVSRNGSKLPAMTFQTSKEILEHASSYDVIGIDEAQFFDTQNPKELMRVVMLLVRQRKHVIVAGLDLDFEEKPFENIAFLMALAEEVVKLSTACMRCKTYSASRSFRKTSGRDRVQIGDKDDYEALCLHCYVPPNGVSHAEEITHDESPPS